MKILPNHFVWVASLGYVVNTVCLLKGSLLYSECCLCFVVKTDDKEIKNTVIKKSFVIFDNNKAATGVVALSLLLPSSGVKTQTWYAIRFFLVGRVNKA